MIHLGKKNILGVLVDAIDYDAAVEKVIGAAKNRTPFSATALAVHGVMTGAMDNTHRHRLNNLDLVVPDGQPVRWALDVMHKSGLADRVYGPNLMLKVCKRAALENLPVYLYGSRVEVLQDLKSNLENTFPDITICGYRPSYFRQITPEEKKEVVGSIKNSGAAIVFIGLGCPRQEVWAYEYRDELSMPLLAVGAAFDFHAGHLAQAPPTLQKYGLEWLFRLIYEPKRLWKRYLYLNPLYLTLMSLQILGLKKYNPADTVPPSVEMFYG